MSNPASSRRLPYGRIPARGSAGATGRGTTVVGRHSLPDQYGAGVAAPRRRGQASCRRLSGRGRGDVHALEPTERLAALRGECTRCDRGERG
ncbi:hypothetical protein EJ357_07460 [Streptomyces cyaneochromogenes]|uniref:Uncharacterized protein n=1 Tax=Streptomyces cyaneochromogenes TaxID=2496836 RepID=A0A3S9M292_9ACTN|nr:hypothetical protein EJ357_07460 [Streptomyces cyaneochromogenes]